MRRILSLVLPLLLISSSFASDTTSDFRKILGAQGYFGTASGESWPYPGGFLVMKKNGGILTFIDPPEDVRPKKANYQTITKVFPSVEKTSKFSLSVVLEGLEAIIGGNPGIGLGHSADLKFAQLTAKGSAISNERAEQLVNSKTMPEIGAWIQSGHRVFVVGVALSTKNISISTDSSTNIDATWNGKPASTCTKSDDKKDKPSSDDKTKPGAKPSSSSPKGLKGMSWRVPADTPQEQGASNQGNPISSTKQTKPGGELHFCKQGSNKLSFKTDDPLIFALGAYEVVNTDATALRHLEPVMTVPKNSGPFNEIQASPGSKGPFAPEMTTPNVAVTDSSEPKWKHLSWAHRQNLP
jgi:hypothetical protein